MRSLIGMALRIERTHFLHNIAGGTSSVQNAGGALYIQEIVDVSISDSTFASNEAVRLACMCPKYMTVRNIHWPCMHCTH